MTIDGKLTLYFSKFSPYTQRVMIAIKEKGIPAEFVEVHLPNKPKGLLEANPIHGKIPAIMHNGKGLGESMVILQYLEDAFPNQVPLLPEDALGKAHVRFWADYVQQFFSKMFDIFRAGPGSPEWATATESVADRLKTLEAAMVSFSAEGPFFAGDNVGLVDVILSSGIVMLPAMGKLCGFSIPEADVLPRYHKWVDAVKGLKSVQETMPTLEEGMVKYTSIAEQRFPGFAVAKS